MKAEIYATNFKKLIRDGDLERFHALGYEWDEESWFNYMDVSMDDVLAIVKTFKHVVVTYYDEPRGHEGIQLTIEIYNDYRE